MYETIFCYPAYSVYCYMFMCSWALWLIARINYLLTYMYLLTFTPKVTIFLKYYLVSIIEEKDSGKKNLGRIQYLRWRGLYSQQI